MRCGVLAVVFLSVLILALSSTAGAEAESARAGQSQRHARHLKATRADTGTARPPSQTVEQTGKAEKGIRTLLQSDAGPPDEETDFLCALTAEQRSEYLTEAERTWTVDDDALEDVQNDLQEIINCTQEGDVVLVNVTRQIQPVTRLTLPWRLTVSGYVDDTSLERDGAFRRSQSPASFTCPSENEGVFLVKEGGVLLANLVFEGCSFNASAESGAIVEVDACQSEGTTAAIQLHRVTFVQNTLADAAGLRISQPSCAEVEMRDVSFANNTCGSVCGARLSSMNVLKNVSIEGNQPLETPEQAPVVLRAPRLSQTTAERLRARSNGVSVLSVIRGSLNLTRSVLSENQVSSSGQISALASCIYLDRSEASVEGSRFESNEAEAGAVFNVMFSTIRVTNATFEDNSATSGGVFYLNESSDLLLENATLVGNSAEDGGVAYLLNAAADLKRSTLANNTAVTSGGSVYTSQSELTIRNCDFSGGNAAYGGILRAGESGVNISDSTILDSRAAERGGGILIRDAANLSALSLTATRNSAGEFGGVLVVQSGSFAEIEQSVFSLNAAVRAGGCFYAEDGASLNLQNTNMTNNTADFGGVIAQQTLASASIADSWIAENTAYRAGGAAYVDTSTLNVERCRFERGSAPGGGELYLTRVGTVTVSDSSFEGGSAEGGGCISSNDGSSVNLTSSSLTGCRAEDGQNGDGSGGAIFASGGGSLLLTDVDLASSTAEFGGGVLCTTGTTVEAVDSRFYTNSASGTGGSWYLRQSNASFSSCEFSEGSARDAGQIYMGDNARLVVRHSTMEKGSAEQNGGCLHSRRDVRVEMVNVTMGECNASNDGGAWWMSETEAQLSNCSFLSNRANRTGGAIRLEESKVTGSELRFLHNSADLDGGGLYGYRSSTVGVSDSVFRNNSAKSGGAIKCDIESNGTFTRAMFVSNSATYGGAGYIKESTTTFRRCTMEKNTAEDGGGLYLSNASVTIRHSELEDTTASEKGACVYARRNSSLSIWNTTMSGGRAKYGGAVSIEGSEVLAQGLTLDRCTAREDGGAIFGNTSSTVLCSSCQLQNNRAEGRGGAISFESASPQGLAVQLDNTAVRDNQAEFGGEPDICHVKNSLYTSAPGGLHFVGPDRDVDCSRPAAKCTFAAIRESVFEGNRASRAGGAVFANDLTAILVDCDEVAQYSELQFLRRRQWRDMSRLNSLDRVCETWHNEATQYGVDLASYGRFVRTSVEFEEENKIEEVVNNRYEVLEHRSGVALPSVHLQVVDELGQGPVIGVNSDTITAYLTSLDGFILGRVSIALEGGKGTLSGAASYRRPGNYTLQISFSDESLTPIELAVNIRDCILGEAESENGQFCETCPGDAYSLVHEKYCHPCPGDAKCDGKAIRPDDGHWHMTPCSTHIQQCLTSDACEYEGRNDRLKEIELQMQTCASNETLAEEYSEAQCKKGYRGALCGSCDYDHGKSRSFSCEECFVGAANVFLILFSIAVLTFLAFFPIRSNLSTRKRPRNSRKATQAPKQTNPNGPGPSVPVNFEMVEMLTTGHVPKPDPNAAPPPTPAEIERNADLAKWKLMELFKITMNYVQVTAFAVSINVEWTAGAVVVFQVAELLSGVVAQAVNFSLDCLISDSFRIERSILGAVLDCMVPLAVIGLLVLFWIPVVGTSKEPDRVTRLIQRVALSVTAVLYVSFISITRSLVNILNCVAVYDSLDADNDSHTRYWAVDTSIKCYEGSHTVLAAVLGWPFLLLFCFFFPLLVAYAVVKNVDKDDYKKGWIYKVSGFMYRAYGKQYLFWETIVMLRKALLAVVVVLAYPLGPNLQAVLAVFVLALALYFQTLCRPYREEFAMLNDLEGISILVSLLTFVSSLFFTDGAVSTVTRSLITVGVLMCNVVLFVFFFVNVLKLAAAYFRTVLDRVDVPYKTTGGTAHVLKVYVIDHSLVTVRESIGRSCAAAATCFVRCCRRERRGSTRIE